MSKVQLSVLIQVSCLECQQGMVEDKPCPRCGGNMHWTQEMPLERAVLMFRDYLRVAEQAESAEKIEKANRARKERRGRSPIVLLGEV